MDGNNNPVEGDTVSLIQDSGKSSNISSASGPTSSSGVVTFTVTDTTAESVIYTATDATDNIIIKQTAGVTFTVTAQGAGETVSSTATAKVVAALVQVAPTVALTYTGTPVIPFGMFTEGRNPGGSAWNSTGSDYGTVTVTPGSDASPSWTVNAFSDNSNGNFANGKMYSAVLNRYLGDAMYVDFSIDGGATWGTYGQLHTGTSVGGTNLSQNFWLGAAQNVSHADVVAGQGDYYIYVQLSAGVTP
jgi:hypothetical protein